MPPATPATARPFRRRRILTTSSAGTGGFDVFRSRSAVITTCTGTTPIVTRRACRASSGKYPGSVEHQGHSLMCGAARRRMLVIVSGTQQTSGMAGVEDTVKDFWATRPRRPRRGRKIAGVAAGIARRYRIDPTLVRVGFVVASVYGGAGIVLYLLGWLFLPEQDDEVSPFESMIGRGRSATSSAFTVLLCLALIPAVSWFFGGFFPGFPGFLSVVVLGGALYLLHRSRGHLGEPAPAPAPAADAGPTMPPTMPTDDATDDAAEHRARRGPGDQRAAAGRRAPRGRPRHDRRRPGTRWVPRRSRGTCRSRRRSRAGRTRSRPRRAAASRASAC